MPDREKQDPATAEESDVSKSQSARQPATQAGQQPVAREQPGQSEDVQQGAERTGDQAANGQPQTGSAPDEGLQGETLAEQRTDIEGQNQQEEGGEEGGFVGSESDADT